MKISIVIPTIRKERMLDFQLPNYALQTFPKGEFEIIIIDDYIDNNLIGESRKDSILDFGKKNGLNIKWMRSKEPYYRSNENIGCARNTGLIHAQGELVIFNDDFSGVRHNYLENVWNVYKQNPGFSHIGPVISVEYEDKYQGNINNLKIINNDNRSKSDKKHYTHHQKGKYNIIKYKHEKEQMSKAFHCSSSWFYTSNVSVPLRNVIRTNGFWEMADLTREEDILMGMTLERDRCKFCFIDDPDISVYHMVHHGSPSYKRYTNVTYKSIGWSTVDIDGRMVEGGGKGGICGLNTNAGSIQLVTKDIFDTKYPGSWALKEYFERNPSLIFNKEYTRRNNMFDLIEERRKIGNWI